MDTCLEHNQEKDFLNIINQMLNELDQNLKFGRGTLCDMKLMYQKLAEEKQDRCLAVIYEVMKENYAVEIYLFGVILRETGDKKAVHYVIKLLESKEYPLWERLNDSRQFRRFLFTDNLLKENEKYHSIRHMYEGFLSEIRQEMNCCYSPVPFKKRKKRIIISVSQIVTIYHAPTAYLAHICRCLEKIGYDVECFVCHFHGINGYWNWEQGFRDQNLMCETGPFEAVLGDVKIKGYNLELHDSDYIDTLRKAVEMIWKEKPEYVLEIGSETILAGLCRGFTTTVTMGMTGALPVTNAQLVISLEERFKEKQKVWETLLDDGQMVVFMDFAVHKSGEQKRKRKYQKKDFGIPEDTFVLILAGNRLDMEIKEDFETVLFQILEQDEHFAVVVIGRCEELEKRFLEGEWKERFYFLGNRTDFREVIGIGDVFINPPRQGGGTGGLFAIMEEVPVITLGDCDVELNSGKEFVCGSIEEMPKLVYKYYKDKEFMDRQKENCRKQAIAKTNVDNEKELWKIHDAVEKYAGRWEENDTF